MLSHLRVWGALLPNTWPDGGGHSFPRIASDGTVTWNATCVSCVSRHGHLLCCWVRDLPAETLTSDSHRLTPGMNLGKVHCARERSFPSTLHGSLAVLCLFFGWPFCSCLGKTGLETPPCLNTRLERLPHTNVHETSMGIYKTHCVRLVLFACVFEA